MELVVLVSDCSVELLLELVSDYAQFASLAFSDPVVLGVLLVAERALGH